MKTNELRTWGNDPATGERIHETPAKPKQTYRYCTDATAGSIEAESLQDALDMVGPTPAQLADGAFAWVEGLDGRRISVGECF